MNLEGNFSRIGLAPAAARVRLQKPQPPYDSRATCEHIYPSVLPPRPRVAAAVPPLGRPRRRRGKEPGFRIGLSKARGDEQENAWNRPLTLRPVSRRRGLGGVEEEHAPQLDHEDLRVLLEHERELVEDLLGSSAAVEAREHEIYEGGFFFSEVLCNLFRDPRPQFRSHDGVALDLAGGRASRTAAPAKQDAAVRAAAQSTWLAKRAAFSVGMRSAMARSRFFSSAPSVAGEGASLAGAGGGLSESPDSDCNEDVIARASAATDASSSL